MNRIKHLDIVLRTQMLRIQSTDQFNCSTIIIKLLNGNSKNYYRNDPNKILLFI